MLNPVSRELNLNNLALVFDVLQGIDAFIFFGTLLGYVREGNIIEYDDDIDVYVNATDLNPLLTALEGSGFNVNVLPIRKKWYHRKKNAADRSGNAFSRRCRNLCRFLFV